jgi:hypothetical protein
VEATCSSETSIDNGVISQNTELLITTAARTSDTTNVSCALHKAFFRYVNICKQNLKVKIKQFMTQEDKIEKAM